VKSDLQTLRHAALSILLKLILCSFSLGMIWLDIAVFKTDTLAALAQFIRTPAFGAVATGLGVLIFSRVFGMGDLWHLILKDGYARLAKTTVEEGVELLTYALWLAACIEHAYAMARARLDSSAPRRVKSPCRAPRDRACAAE
jgi:hypothetical protein